MCMVLMNQLLLLTNKNVTGLMRSVKQNVSCNYLDASNFRDIFKSSLQYTVMPLQTVRAFNRIRIISNSNLNLTKRKERNLWTDSLDSKTQQVNEVLYDK